jgi:hypothetical protein
MLFEERIRKLPLTSRKFAVLRDADVAPTCHTDATGTSRSAAATLESPLAFADRVSPCRCGSRRVTPHHGRDVVEMSSFDLLRLRR